MFSPNELRKQLGMPARLAISVGLFAIALLIRLWILPVEAGYPFVTFYPAMVMSFYLCGIASGLLTTILCGIAARYLFIPPYWSFAITSESSIALLAFAVSSILLGLVAWQLLKYEKNLLDSESQLRLSEDRYQGYLNDQTELICRYLPDLTITYVNNAFCRFFNMDSSELVGTIWSPIAHEDDMPMLMKALNSLSPTNPVAIVENRVIAGDGSVRWCSFINHAFFDEEGRVVETQSVGRDVTDRKLAEQDVEKEKAKLANLLSTASDGIHILDENGNLLECSQSFLRMLGYADNESKGLNVRDWDKDIPSEQVTKTIKDLIQSPRAFETRHRRKDGSVFDVEINAKGVAINGKKYLYASTRDITERKKLAQELNFERNMLNSLVNTITDLVWLKDVHGIYLKCNAEFEKFFGAKEVEITGKTDYDFVSKELADSFRENDQMALNSNAPRSNEEMVTYQSNGHTALLETIKTPMRDEHGVVIGVLGISRDITERKHLEEQVSHMAYYDVLTKLPNRRLLLDRLNQLLVGKKRSGFYGALLFIDLDNFKPLNDLHGHEAGDLLLIEVGKRIKECVREMDTVARIGGDEFIALIGQLKGEEAQSLAQAEMIAEKVRIALDKPYLINIEHGKNAESTIEYSCTASIGVVVFSGKATDPEVLLSMADVAMYEAKEAGRNQVRLNPSVI